MSNRLSRFEMPVLLVIGTILVLGVVLGLAQAASPAPADAQSTTEQPRRTDIAVNGTGRVYAAPDTAFASVGVDITAPTLAEATKQASDAMEKVLAAIKAQGVAEADIQTTSYNIYPITSQPKEGESPSIVAYRVNNIVTVKIRDITAVGKVLDAAITAGANSVNNVYFTVDDPVKYENEARTLAVKDAMAKAQVLATAAGVKVGKVVIISETGGGVTPLYREVYAAAPAALEGAGPIATGQNEIRIDVEMHFEIAE